MAVPGADDSSASVGEVEVSDVQDSPPAVRDSEPGVPAQRPAATAQKWVGSSGSGLLVVFSVMALGMLWLCGWAISQAFPDPGAVAVMASIILATLGILVVWPSIALWPITLSLDDDGLHLKRGLINKHLRLDEIAEVRQHKPRGNIFVLPEDGDGNPKENRFWWKFPGSLLTPTQEQEFLDAIRERVRANWLQIQR